MSRTRKNIRGRCIWPGCPEPGVFFTGRTVGMEKRWGYACEVHERVIAAENMDRYQEEAMFSNARTPWGIGARNTA